MQEQIKVILVGPDCGGKSTLAEMLRKYYDIPKRSNRRPGSDLATVYEMVDFALHHIPFKPFILDQWQFPVDIVYRGTLNNERSPITCLTEYLLPHLEQHKVLFLHITASDDVLRQRFDVRGDALWNIDQILRVSGAYDAYLPHSGITYETIDTTALGPKAVLAEAVKVIEKFYGSDEE